MAEYDDRNAVPKDEADRADAGRRETNEDKQGIVFRTGVAAANRLRCSMRFRAPSAALSRALSFNSKTGVAS